MNNHRYIFLLWTRRRTNICYVWHVKHILCVTIHVMQISTMSCRYPLCRLYVHFGCNSQIKLHTYVRPCLPKLLMFTLSLQTSLSFIWFWVPENIWRVASCTTHICLCCTIYLTFLYFLAYMFYVKASINKCYVCIWKIM